MKKSLELKNMLQESLFLEKKGGLLWTAVKKAIAKEYEDYVGGGGDGDERTTVKILKAPDTKSLVDALYNAGFDFDDAVEFIFDAIYNN